MAALGADRSTTASTIFLILSVVSAFNSLTTFFALSSAVEQLVSSRICPMNSGQDFTTLAKTLKSFPPAVSDFKSGFVSPLADWESSTKTWFFRISVEFSPVQALKAQRLNQDRIWGSGDLISLICRVDTHAADDVCHFISCISKHSKPRD